MDPVDTTSETPTPSEQRLFQAAARFVVDSVPVSPEETRESFAEVRSAIRRATAGTEADVSGATRQGDIKLSLSRMPYTGAVRRGYRPAWYAAFAAVLMLVAFAVGRSAVGPQRGLRHSGPTAVMTYTTHNGERADVTFPDGSSAILNVGSRLQVPADFAAGNRTVRLDGEALFTIAHHAGAPFTVATGNTTTRVLGTTFLVRRYSTDTLTTIAVQDGRVAVGSAVVAARQQATVSQAGTLRVGTANPAQFTFAYGTLTLDDVSLRDAIVELNRWYDVDLRLGDAALARRALHATFGVGSADLTEVLSVALNVRAVQDGRVITLYPK